MSQGSTKMIIVPVDGSENSLRSLDYLNVTHGCEHDLEVCLFYVLPTLPSILVADADRKTKMRLLDVEENNVQMAEEILMQAREYLLKKGFEEERLTTKHRKKQMGVAQDICNYAEDKRADAVLISSKGRSRLEAFWAGEVSSKLLELCRVCPVWIVEGAVKSKKVLVAMDRSDNAVRAADHAGFMLSGTECQVTLFHSLRELRRFMPQAVLDEAPELEELWKHKAGQGIAPYMKKVKEILSEAGFSEVQIRTKVVDGTRSAAADILKEARDNNFGTIVLGRWGRSGVKEFFMGSVTSKVLQLSAGMAVWVVH